MLQPGLPTASLIRRLPQKLPSFNWAFELVAEGPPGPAEDAERRVLREVLERLFCNNRQAVILPDYGGLSASIGKGASRR